jgi:DNA-binding SARP family transcriptional activator
LRLRPIMDGVCVILAFGSASLAWRHSDPYRVATRERSASHDLSMTIRSMANRDPLGDPAEARGSFAPPAPGRRGRTRSRGPDPNRALRIRRSRRETHADGAGRRPVPATHDGEELKIRCFGTLTLERAGRSLTFPTRRARTLFAYLVLHRDRPCPRELVSAALWGGEPDLMARKYLRTELWRLRRNLEPRGTSRGTYLHVGADEIWFKGKAPYWLDIDEFETRARPAMAERGDGLTREQAGLLEGAVALYRGDLCENIDEACLGDERERFRQLLRGALERLMAHHGARREWDLAIDYGQRLLRSDPLLEHVHRELMRFHYAKGDRPAALRQYQCCLDFLSRELGIDPMIETASLYHAMRTGNWCETPTGDAARLEARRESEPVVASRRRF